VGYVPGQTTVTVVTDTTPPTVTCTLSGTEQNGWYRTDVGVSLTATDDSGILYLQYSYNNATWSSYSDTITLSSEGSTTVYWRCSDIYGNIAYGNKEAEIDKSAPSLAAEVVPPAPDVNGWYNQSVQVNFIASDALSGVASVTPNATLGEGAGQSVTGTATDRAGNSRSMTVNGINIDLTAPATSAAISGTAGNNGWYTGDVTVTLSASDGLSDIYRTEYSTNGGTTRETYTAPLTIAREGTTTVYYRSTDIAGNVEATHDISFKVDKTAPEITGALSGAKSRSGWFEGDATLTLGYSDATSGISSVMYSLDGSRWSAYTGPVTVPRGVSHSVYFGAIDQAGNRKNGSAFTYFQPASVGDYQQYAPMPTASEPAGPTVTPTVMPTANADRYPDPGRDVRPGRIGTGRLPLVAHPCGPRRHSRSSGGRIPAHDKTIK